MKLEDCIEFMKEKHKGQKRKQGTPFEEDLNKELFLLKEKRI